MKKYRPYLIVFGSFVAVLILLFAVNTHFLNLQKYGIRVTLTIISAIWWGLLFWAAIDRLRKRKAYQELSQDDYQFAFAFVFAVVGIVIL
jgi:hypothetical protein